MRSLWFRFLLVFGLLCAAQSAHAEETAAPVITPPELETFVPASLPAEATAAGSSGVVELILTVDDSGHVADAQVEHGPGLGLDQAALEAARQFVFRPATRDGKPFSARIRYRYVFEPAAPVVAPPARGELTGKVEQAAAHVALVGADILLTDAEGTQYTTTSDAAGRFSLRELAPGTYTLSIHALNFAPISTIETVAAGARLELSFALLPVSTQPSADFAALARVEAEVHEVVRRSIPREDLVRTAGTRGDPLRIVELLPGVARPPGGQGMVLIRGSAPADSQVFLGGSPIYSLYHFGGLTSVVNGFLLAGIDLYPGNFSVRYGRKVGGVIESAFRDPKTDRVHGVLDVNTIDSSLLFEAPITDKLSIALAGRRSYMDAWYGPLAESADLQVGSAPVYYDYQAILAYKPTRRDRIRLVGYGSFDRIKLGLAATDEHDPAVRGTFEDKNQYNRAQLEWFHSWSDKVSSDLTVAAGPLKLHTTLGTAIGFDIQGYDVIVRNEWHVQLHPKLKLNVGLDAQFANIDVAYTGPVAQQAEGDPSAMGPLTGREITTVAEQKSYLRPALYSELVAQVTKRLELTAGARVDYFGDVEKFAVDPRLSARVLLGSTTLRAGVGLFSQPPDYVETLNGFGYPQLSPVRALHYGAGVEQSFGRYGMLSLDGFYKQLSNVVVNARSETGTLENRGEGRIYGMEVLGRLQPVGRLSGFVAYTLSRSERNDKDGTGYRLFDYDQTHILSASGNLALGRGWTFGSTFRLVSGNPATPVTGSLYQANLDVYLPTYGATNSTRDSMFHRLDVRIEKRWAIGRGALTWYLDVQNVYNRQNSEGKAYNYNYTRSKDNPGLPILPSIGLRGEL